MTRRTLLSLVVAAGVTSAVFAGGKWQTLFDGKTLAGWERKAVHGGNGGLWNVERGLLVGNQESDHKGGLLGTAALYQNCEVELEFLADYPCDSGLFLRTTPTGDAYQITIDNRDGGTIGDLYVPSSGFAAQNPAGKAGYKPGKWNRLRAEVVGQPAHVRAWLNDKPTVDFQDTQNRLNAPGYIGLQVHGGPGSWADNSRIRFRKVRVRSLDPPHTSTATN